MLRWLILGLVIAAAVIGEVVAGWVAPAVLQGALIVGVTSVTLAATGAGSPDGKAAPLVPRGVWIRFGLTLALLTAATVVVGLERYDIALGIGVVSVFTAPASWFSGQFSGERSDGGMPGI
jgi:hypothetical protein